MSILAFITNLAGPQGLILLVIVVFLFGGKKLPEVGRSIGESMKAFNKGKNGEDDEEKKP